MQVDEKPSISVSFDVSRADSCIRETFSDGTVEERPWTPEEGEAFRKAFAAVIERAFLYGS